MDRSKRAADLLISNGRQPTGIAGLGAFVKERSHRMEEQDVYQSVSHFDRSGSAAVKLRNDVLDCRSGPPGRSAFTAFKVEQRREAAHQEMAFSVLDSAAD
jgi:hypothetical protein